MSCITLTGKSAEIMRVWTSELPSEALVSDSFTSERRVIPASNQQVFHGAAALEIFRALGASFQYAMLGAEFDELPSGNLEIVIPVEDPSPAREFSSSLAGSLDAVMVGGGAEYGSAIFRGIAQLSKHQVPSGVLTIKCIANGAVGSSPMIFSSLGRALIRTMTAARPPDSLEAGVQLLAP